MRVIDWWTYARCQVRTATAIRQRTLRLNAYAHKLPGHKFTYIASGRSRRMRAKAFEKSVAVCSATRKTLNTRSRSTGKGRSEPFAPQCARTRDRLARRCRADASNSSRAKSADARVWRASGVGERYCQACVHSRKMRVDLGGPDQFPQRPLY